GRLSLGARERPGQALPGAPTEEARQAQSPGHPGRTVGPRRLSDAAAEEGVRSQTLLERRARRHVGPAEEVCREAATSRQGIAVRFGGITPATDGTKAPEGLGSSGARTSVRRRPGYSSSGCIPARRDRAGLRFPRRQPYNLVHGGTLCE